MVAWSEKRDHVLPREIRFFISGRALSGFGIMMANVALTFVVLDLTHSIRDLSLVLAARSLPQVIFLPLGGHLGDKYRKEKVIMAFTLLAGISQLTAFSLLIVGSGTIARIALCELINGVSIALTLPAAQSIIPEISESKSLQQINALSAFTRNIALLLGPLIAGVLLTAISPVWLLGINGCTFMLAAYLFSKCKTVNRIHNGNKFLAQFIDGLSAFRSKQWLWLLVAVAGVENGIFSAGWITLGPVVANSTVGRSNWGMIMASQSVGLVLGATLLVRFRVKNPLRIGLFGIASMCIPIFALGVHPTISVLIISAFISGFGLEIFSVNWISTLQTQIEPQALSRISALDVMVSYSVIPIGQFAAAYIYGALGHKTTFVLLGSIYLACALLPLSVKSVRNLRYLDTSIPIEKVV